MAAPALRKCVGHVGPAVGRAECIPAGNGQGAFHAVPAERPVLRFRNAGLSCDDNGTRARPLNRRLRKRAATTGCLAARTGKRSTGPSRDCKPFMSAGYNRESAFGERTSPVSAALTEGRAAREGVGEIRPPGIPASPSHGVGPAAAVARCPSWKDAVGSMAKARALTGVTFATERNSVVAFRERAAAGRLPASCFTPALCTADNVPEHSRRTSTGFVAAPHVASRRSCDG